jgi:nitronate monooxygenase
MIIESPVGMPGRAIRNRFLEDVAIGKKKPFNCPYHCIITCKEKASPYCIALALSSAYIGKLNRGFAFAGANAYRNDRIVPVRKLFAELLAEYADDAPAPLLP